MLERGRNKLAKRITVMQLMSAQTSGLLLIWKEKERREHSWGRHEHTKIPLLRCPHGKVSHSLTEETYTKWCSKSITKQNKSWVCRAPSYLSWSPTGFILKGDGLAHRGGFSSGTHWPWGSTTTLTTFGACSGWTMLLVVLDWAVCRGRGERWISCFFSFSCLSDSWIFSFNLYRTYRNKEENSVSVPW